MALSRYWVRVMLGLSMMGGANAIYAQEEAYIAVASNFLKPLQKLQAVFEKTKFDKIKIISGSTGKLYAQIVNGAPFDVFLAASSREPALLVSRGIAVADTQFTYARGQLVLWSRNREDLADHREQLLVQQKFRYVALANPNVAPYGLGAMDVLMHLNIATNMQSQLVKGENVAQVYQFVASGNAEVGFVAFSQLIEQPKIGSYWLIPVDWYQPIEQQAVLLRRGANNPVAIAFIEFLQSEVIQTMIREQLGYL